MLFLLGGSPEAAASSEATAWAMLSPAKVKPVLHDNRRVLGTSVDPGADGHRGHVYAGRDRHFRDG